MIALYGNIERSHETMYKLNTKKGSKEVKSNNFCYWKVERALTKWGAKVVQYCFCNIEKMYNMIGRTKIIFTNCTFDLVKIIKLRSQTTIGQNNLVAKTYLEMNDPGIEQCIQMSASCGAVPMSTGYNLSWLYVACLNYL